MSDLLDDFYEEPKPVVTPPPPTKKKGSGCLLNLLSGILVVGTLVVTLLFGIIFLNPQSGINPYPPPTIPAVVLTNTPTPTPKGLLPATWTPTSSPTATLTPTPTSTDTPQPTDTPVPTADLEVGTTFTIQEGSPSYEVNTFHPDAGCDWLGVAGQIFDQDGAPVSGILVESGGMLGEIELSGLTLSGMAPAYGEGGYEITLGNAPADSDGEIWIQLLDQANLPLSEKVIFQTFNSCDSNLVKINFVQVVGQ